MGDSSAFWATSVIYIDMILQHSGGLLNFSLNIEELKPTFNDDGDFIKGKLGASVK